MKQYENRQQQAFQNFTEMQTELQNRLHERAAKVNSRVEQVRKGEQDYLGTVLFNYVDKA